MKLMLVGTYGAARENLFVYHVDEHDGALSLRTSIQAGADPSFVHVDAARDVAFVVNEGSRMVQAFGAISTTTPTLISQTASGGGSPCFVTLDPSGNYLLIANYGGQCVTICPVNADGTLQPICQTLAFTGSSVNTERQRQSHPHSVAFSPDGRYIYVPDLGSDKVWIYRWIGSGERPADTNMPSAVNLPAGSGPRMICFSADARHAHVINELTATVTTFAYAERDGSLTALHQSNLLPAEYAGAKGAAHIICYGDKILASNRGHDSIVTLGVDSVAHISTGGKVPRHFTLDPAAQRLYVANQASDNIVQFDMLRDGTMVNEQVIAQVQAPTCLVLISINKD